MSTHRDPPEISHAVGSLAYTTGGQCLTDLMIGFGAVFLGHCHPQVTERLREQLLKVWLCGRCPTPAAAQADALIREILPAGFRPGGLYSTGMEAAEFAMRLAATQTARSEFAGFARSMHGKSAMTASLCWDNAPVRSEHVHILPFVDAASEDEILGRLSRLLGTGRIAAVFVEPIQGSNGAREASQEFYERLIAACRACGTLCVFDEILTGLYRTGTAFYAERLSTQPDFLLFAKSMANGFPVSSIAIPTGMAIGPQSLPGSTFSGNPLAATAVAATLAAMRDIPMAARVADIEATVLAAFAGARDGGITLRGRGAFWVLELGPRVHVPRALAAIRESGLLVSSHGRFVRLLPAVTIDLDALRDACERIVRACACAYA